MDNKKIPASPESRKELYERMGKIISDFSRTLQEFILLKDDLRTKNPNENDEIFKAFSSLYIYVLYMNIETSSILRASFRTDILSEKRYHLKLINALILESYKHLYGYGKILKKSLWISKIQPLIKVIKEPDFKHDYEILTKTIKAFGEKNITDKRQRDFAYHYDSEPSKVFDMLMNLSEEVEAQRINNFLSLLQDLCSFIEKHMYKYKVEINSLYKIRSYKYDMLSFVDIKFFGEKTESIYSDLGNSINLNTNHLNSYIRHQNLPSILKKQFKDCNSESFSHILRLLEIEKIVIQLTFLNIDLASIIRAFITSEYKIEKLLSVKRTNAVVYEGIKKIYGFNSNREDSFWTKYIIPVATNDTDIYDEFLKLNNEFLKFELSEDFLIKNRNISDHFKVELEELYDVLFNLNPVVVFEKSIELLKLIPRIIKFLTQCLSIIDREQKKEREQTKLSMNQNIENLMSLLNNTPDTPQKKDLIQKLEDIKSGNFFDEILKRKK